MNQGKVGKDERASRAHRLWFANDVPVNREPRQIARELCFHATVEAARFRRWKDRVARAQLERMADAVEIAGGAQAETPAPGQERHQFAKRTPVEQRTTEQCERPRHPKACRSVVARLVDQADETP